MERKLTAILSADVKGYSRLMGEDEEATLRSSLSVIFPLPPPTPNSELRTPNSYPCPTSLRSSCCPLST